MFRGAHSGDLRGTDTPPAFARAAKWGDAQNEFDDGLDHLAIHLDSSPHADHVAAVTQTTTTSTVTTTASADDAVSTVKDGLREAYDKTTTTTTTTSMRGTGGNGDFIFFG
ncbi:hypothetical protein JCM24511_01288 [Saitozyma sp. JCM 24511]|nr:hypothetical protein JCM24511_01288 [Saitozyma sp. JCM 24511]